ncbi:MAG: hypothetical protein WBW25_09420 [Halobacteriota archaeon]|jgi:hypothetical protein
MAKRSTPVRRYDTRTNMPEKQVKPKLTQTQMELETRDKRRLETFIDGVFAIAMTLLGPEFCRPARAAFESGTHRIARGHRT